MKVFVPIAALLIAAASAHQGIDSQHEISSFEEPMTVEEFDNIFTRFGHIISKYGHEGLEFLRCLGPSFLSKCPTQTLGCATTHNPVSCWGLLKCEGVPAANCIHHIKEEHAHDNDSTTHKPSL